MSKIPQETLETALARILSQTLRIADGRALDDDLGRYVLRVCSGLPDSLKDRLASRAWGIVEIGPASTKAQGDE